MIKRFLFERVERPTEASEETVAEKEPSKGVAEGSNQGHKSHDDSSKVRKAVSESPKTHKENKSENENETNDKTWHWLQQFNSLVKFGDKYYYWWQNEKLSLFQNGHSLC